MSIFAEGTSMTRPPLLNDTNYPYWKVRMRAFIKSQDERAWRSILTGWKPPVEQDDEGNAKVKSELEWTHEDEKLSGYNNKALHAIFNGVGEGFIKLISSCDSAKEAWQILQTQFEGTADVKRSRFTMLQTKFDELRMSENETLTEFYERLSDISNEFFSLGEKLEESVIVRKIVRVLPDRFDTKLLAMEEAKDFGKMKVEELMGSLRTFELNQEIKKKGKAVSSHEKSKGIAFNVSDKEKEISDNEDDDDLALLTRNFQKFIKKVGNKKSFSKNPKENFSSKPFVSNKKGIQCRECEGYGHIQSECANTLKKNKKGFTATWSDSDTSDEENENIALTSVLQEKENFLCLNNSSTGTFQAGESDSDESELNEESLVESYKVMYGKWMQVYSENRSLVKTNKELLLNIEDLERKNKCCETELQTKNSEISFLTKELDNLKRNVKMLNPGSNIFEKIQNTGQVSHAGLGFVENQ